VTFYDSLVNHQTQKKKKKKKKKKTKKKKRRKAAKSNPVMYRFFSHLSSLP